MKITKKQLKRIIAEEHAVVYGKTKPSRRRTRKLTSKQRRIVEARKKRAILKEAQRNYACNQVIEEGFGKFLKQVGGMFSKGVEQAAKIKDNTVAAWKDLGDKIDADEKKMNDFREEMKADISDFQAQLQKAIQGYKSFAAITDELPEDKKEEKTKELFAAAIALMKAELAAMT